MECEKCGNYKDISTQMSPVCENICSNFKPKQHPLRTRMVQRSSAALFDAYLLGEKITLTIGKSKFKATIIDFERECHYLGGVELKANLQIKMEL